MPNFTEILSKRPKALHLSCHGVSETKGSLGTNDYLVFEKLGGEGEFIEKKKIGEILLKNSAQLELVFVAACMSRNVGEMFLKNGVKHVICIDHEKTIQDESILQFTNRFYKMIFSGRNICEAFDQAKQEVKNLNSEGQAQRLFMLCQEDLAELDPAYMLKVKRKHICHKFAQFEKGFYKDTTDQADLRKFPGPL